MMTHMCISVTGALKNWQDSLYVGCCTDENGRTMEPWEVKAVFVKAASEGKKVLPMDPYCDNFDYQKGCLGHEEAHANRVWRSKEAVKERR